MRNVEGRMKALEKRIPPEPVEGSVWLANKDGTMTGGGRTITREQFEREAAENGDTIVSMKRKPD